MNMNNIPLPSRASPSPAEAISITAANNMMAYMNVKPGCRGDPRYNKAVQAKLKNPKLSLFDALLAGGFYYPRNVDASTMDNESVTLGQRKNQLNRRLRMAKKNLREKEQGSKDQNEAAVNKPKSMGANSPLVVAGSYLRSRKSSGGSAKSSPNSLKKRVTPPLDASIIQASKKQCTTTSNNQHCTTEIIDSHRPPPQASSQNDQSLFNALFTARSHHVIQHNRDNMGGTTHEEEDEDASLKSLLEETGLVMPDNNIANSTTPMTGGSHWASEHCFVNSSDLRGDHNLVVTTPGLDMVVQATSDESHLVEQYSSFGRARPVSTNNSIASATTTTSCNSNDQQQDSTMLWLQASQQPHPPQQEPNHELGLRFFQAGLQELYQKSMMVAGYTPSDVMDESSHAYQSFVHKAWERVRMSSSSAPGPTQV